jgi:hypothetical protein
MIIRREFIAGRGAVAAWPLMAWAQQSKVPVIGFLTGNATNASRETAFRQGLKDSGYSDGQNVSVECYADRLTQNQPINPRPLHGRAGRAYTSTGDENFSVEKDVAGILYPPSRRRRRDRLGSSLDRIVSIISCMWPCTPGVPRCRHDGHSRNTPNIPCRPTVAAGLRGCTSSSMMDLA